MEIMGLYSVPLELKEVHAFVSRLHRHHKPTVGDKFRCGVMDKYGIIHGVVQVGRPVARELCDGNTVEVLRLCTDGTKNACSFLYAHAAQAARALGYKKIITYILESEIGTTLLASGWHKESDIKGHTWDTPSRNRVDKHPICDKQRYAKILNDHEVNAIKDYKTGHEIDGQVEMELGE